MRISKVYVTIICTVVISFVVTSCATGRKAYVAQENEEYYGTWGNTENNEKFINLPDGTYKHYFGKSDKPRWYGTFTITDKWKDAEGNIWYKITLINQIGVSRYVLNRIDTSEQVLEYVYFSNDYPTELDTKLMSYRIYYRP